MSDTMYRFSPDFRRNQPKGDQVYCAHCMRAVNKATAVPVSIDWDGWIFVEGHNNQKLSSPNMDLQAYFGATCYQKMEKEKYT